MAKARSSGLLHQVRTLFGAGVAAGLSDGELLDRFLSRSAVADDAAIAAEAAFAALVARHGPMVLGVCRRALADPNDVDDAFQARLRWPVGTVSGRLSRARDLLRNRLVRRGMAPTAGSMVALLATDGARAAVSEPLAAATVRAATRLAMGSGSQAGVGSVSASALSLMNAVLRAAVMIKLKVAAAFLLAIVVAGAAVGAAIGVRTGAPDLARDQDAGGARAAASRAVAHPTADHRAADEIVKEIEAALAMAAELRVGDPTKLRELRLMPNVNDLNALPSAGKRLIIVADVNHALHLRLFDVEGKMVLDSDAKRLTNTWADYLQHLVPTLWPPHELTHIEKISVINAVTTLAGRTWQDEMQRVHGRIAALAGELRTVYPHDPRVGHYLPERWASLTMFGQAGVVYSEIREVLDTTKDPELRSSALYFETSLRFSDLIDGRAAVSLAESFAVQAPGDKRAAELFHLALHKLDAKWQALARLAAVFAMFAGLLAATIGIGRWLKYALRVGVVLLALFAVTLAGLSFLADDTLIAIIRSSYEKISDGSAMVPSRLLTVPGLGHEILQQYRVLAGTFPAAFAVMLAALCAVFLVVARRRFAEPRARWPSAIRLGVLGFFAVLAASCGVDACLIGFQRSAIRERIVRDYPAFRGKLIQGERRQR